MAKENKFGQMELYMKDIGETMNLICMEELFMNKEQHLKDNGKKDNLRDLEFIIFYEQEIINILSFNQISKEINLKEPDKMAFQKALLNKNFQIMLILKALFIKAIDKVKEK